MYPFTFKPSITQYGVYNQGIALLAALARNDSEKQVPSTERPVSSINYSLVRKYLLNKLKIP